MSDKALGYCGLYCGACGVYQATRAGTPKTDDSGNAMLCDGCDSDRCTSWCSDCAIKNCARTKGYRVCLECSDNPCGMLSGFMNDPKYPYHQDVQDDMRVLVTDGFQVMAKTVIARYTCPSCGLVHDWFAKTCISCGKTLGIPQKQ